MNRPDDHSHVGRNQCSETRCQVLPIVVVGLRIMRVQKFVKNRVGKLRTSTDIGIRSSPRCASPSMGAPFGERKNQRSDLRAAIKTRSLKEAGEALAAVSRFIWEPDSFHELAGSAYNRSLDHECQQPSKL